MLESLSQNHYFWDPQKWCILDPPKVVNLGDVNSIRKVRKVVHFNGPYLGSETNTKPDPILSGSGRVLDQLSTTRSGAG